MRPANFKFLMAALLLAGLAWFLFRGVPSGPRSGFQNALAVENNSGNRSPEPDRGPGFGPDQPVSVDQHGSPSGDGDAHDHEKHLPNLDVRGGAVWVATPAQDRAVEALRRKVPGVDVQFDPVSGAPSHVMAAGSFLTGPEEGQGEGGLRRFLDENRELFGYGSEVLEKGVLLAREDVTAGSGLRTLVWQQELDGVPLYDTVFRANLTSRGELLGVGSHFLKDPASATGMNAGQREALKRKPPVSVARALELASAGVGEGVSASEVRVKSEAVGARRMQELEGEKVSDARAELVWVPLGSKRLVLAWELTWMSREEGEMFRAAVNAESGDLLVRTSLTSDLSPASYRVHVNPETRKPLDSPQPMSPGHATPQTGQPPQQPRSLVTWDALDLTASPQGWIPEGGGRTSGNNVDVHLDLSNANPGYGVGPHAVGQDRVFDFPMALDQEPAQYREAAMTTLFYLCNWYHDRLYSLGFTETAGNFQQDNFGRGGSGLDAVLADVQDGGGTNNANFSTPRDGFSGRMQMYVFTTTTPGRDSSLDAEVVFHEYTHGLSNRLVGGGVGINALQSAGMGEGWSDFYGLSLLSEAGDEPGGNYAAGGYLTGNYYRGIRTYPYTTDLAKNPHTLKQIDPTQGGRAQVHYMGEVWCVTLWEARANLIAKHGWQVGNELMLQLVTDGMKLSPVNPTFLQARDAILQADLNLTRGANQRELWQGFAKRGMGASARVPASSTSTGVAEAFDLPDSLRVTPLEGVTFQIQPPTRSQTGSQRFVLNNLDAENELRWTAASAASWLAVSPVGGVLAPGGSTEVVLGLRPESASLPIGSYSGQVGFKNLGSGVEILRNVSLSVGNRDAYTEAFGAGSANDTDFQSWMFVPDGSSSFYRVERTVVQQFPSDPAGGTVLPMTDDTSVRVSLPAGRTASVYGSPYGQIYVGSNGYLTFAGSDTGYVESYGAHFAQPRVSGVFCDLIPVEGSVVSWKAWTDRVSVTWEAMGEYGRAGRNSFQMELYQDGRIRITCLGVDAVGGLIGLSRGGGIPSGFVKSDFSRYSLESPDEQVLGWEVPVLVSEGDGWVSARVNLSQPALADTGVTLSSSAPERLQVPDQVTIPAGSRSVDFDLKVLENQRVDGETGVILQASVPGGRGAAAVVAVRDNETGGSLSMRLPETLQEGGADGQGTLMLSVPAEVALQVSLVATVPEDVWVPATVTVPQGAQSAQFPIRAVNDIRIDGTVLSGVRASVWGWQDGTASISALDNESRQLTFTGFPQQISEGRSLSVGVSISGTLREDLTVSLTSANSERLSVPQSVTIRAGATAATLVLSARDNNATDGPATVGVTASAAGFESAQRNVLVLDGDTYRFTVSPVGARQIRGVPIPITVTALDANGAVARAYNSSFEVWAVGASGSQSVTRMGGSSFTAGVWSGSVVVNNSDTGVSVRFAGPGGLSAQTNTFDVGGRVLDHFGWTLPQGEQPPEQGAAVRLEALDEANNRVESFSGSVRLSGRVQQDVSVAPGTPSRGSSTFPLNTWWPVQRTQCVYTAGQVGGPVKIHSLALNFILPPPGTVGRWTIRMRHTEIAEPVVWEPDGWVTVFQQDTTISTPGWIPFQFQVPFEYNGVSNLMVDFSFKSAEPQSRGAVVECSTDSTRRRPSITRTMSSGDPLEWSGNTPGAGRVFEAPNLRLGVEVAVTPAVTSNFVSGVWNGEVVFPQGYRAIQLRAVSDTGIVSESQPVVFHWVTPSAVTVDSSPVGGRVSEGRALTLRASAQGTRPFTYRWTRDGEPIRGATSPGYTVPQVSYAHRGEYRVEVTNPAGVATSSPFTVTVDPILEILEQPVSQTVNPRSPVTFAVRAEGMGTLQYQWYKNGEPLPDQIRPSLVLPAVAEGDQADYWVVVSNEFDRKTSDWAGLEVNDPVSLSTHPVGAVLMPGQSHELRVEASGTGPLEYQWSRNGARIDGATGSVLVFNSVTESVEGDYTVSVRNVVGVVISESARIRVVDQIGFISQGIRQPKFPGELLFPVTVRRFGGGESGGAVRIVPISSTLPESAFRTLPVPAELRWAPGDPGEKTYLVAVKAGVQIRPGGEQMKFGLEGFQDAAPGENLLQVVTLVQADPGVLNFGAEKLEIQSSGTADRFVEVPVVRNQGSVGSAGVEVAVAGGTAPAGSYFLETQGPVLWQDREVAPKLVRVRFAAGQAVPARGWTIDLRLQNPTGGALIGPVNTVRIRVNPPDARGVLAFGAPVYRFQRPQAVDQEVSIPVYRSAGSVGRVAVMLETASAMAVEGPDYLIPPESRMFLWEDGEVEPKYFKLVLHETARVPANGLKIQVRLSGPAGGAVLGAPSSALLTFLNADDQPPQLSVVTPASGATVSGESVLFKGTAMDMAGVERVEVALNGEMPVAASLVPLPDGTGVTWMATLIPEPGQNQVRVTAMGGDGMVSEPVVRRFRFVRQRPDLAGTYDGLLEPAANLQEFSVVSPDYRPFELSRGTGILSTTVSASGALSGRVCIAGAEVPFTGTVQRDGTVLFAGGTSELRVLRPGQRESLGGLGLWVDENGERPVLRGEFKAVETRALYARITAEKCVFSDAKALPPGMRRVPSEVLDPSSDNGRYTLAWLREPTLGPGQSNDLRGLAGSLEGTGALRVSPNGNVTLVGRLRYSTVSCGSRLSPSGRVPFHQGMLRQNGFVTGRLPLGLPETNADAVADFSLWVLPPWGVGAREEARPALLASRYVAPSRPRAGRPEPANPHTVFGVAFPAAQPEGGRGLPSLAVDMDLDSAVLGDRFEGVLRLGMDGNAVLVAANTPNVSDVRFRFETADGTFGAGFRIPGVRSSLPLQGVVFQKQGIGLGLGETGGSFTVELTPRLSQPMGGVRVP